MRSSQLYRRAGAVMGVLLLLAGCTDPTLKNTAPEDSAALETIIAAVATGWETADGAPFRKHYLDFPGARYVESGGQNDGLTDLVEHHVEPEGDALDGLDLAFTNIETHFEGNFAWAIADVEVKAVIKRDGSMLHKTGYETFLFRYVEGEWKVVHTHSSTRTPRH